MDYDDDYRHGQEIEPDSDVDDPDSESQLSQWLGELENYAKGLEPGDTGTVKRRQKTVVTQKMAMDSFRYSFLSENQELSFDAILGELSELETQLGTAHPQSTPLHMSSPAPPYDHCLAARFLKDDQRDSGNDLAQAELDALATEITHSLGGYNKHKRPMAELEYFHTHHYPGDLGGYSDAMLDIAETDSAFSESVSLPSSESFTSMVTVSSSADAAGMGDMSSISSGSTITGQSLQCDSVSCPCMRFANNNTPTPTNQYPCAMDMWSDQSLSNHQHHQHHQYQQHQHQHHQQQYQQQYQQHQHQQHQHQQQHLYNHHQHQHHLHPQQLEEQKARLQAEKIRIALEKIKEAKIKKLFVRAFASDGSSKSILCDEKMTILDVISLLSDKNHVRLHSDLAVIEHMPDLFMERVLEDHDSLVENMVMWTRDTKNKILFENRVLKNDLFKTPERYLLMSSSSEKGASLDPKRRENLIQEFFSGNAIHVPEVEGVLYLKSDGKKAWKKYYFVLRASGLYYNPKGKISKSPKDLQCLVQFEYVELYDGLHWKKKYHSPTDYCFALKHPQIQKKTSKFIRYLCAENKAALDQWIMGIRIAKYGKQLLINFQSLQREILQWDSRDVRLSLSDQADAVEAIAELNQQGALTDSRLSMPEPGSRHSLVSVNVKDNPAIVRDVVDSRPQEVLIFDGEKLERNNLERKSSLTGSGGQCATAAAAAESVSRYEKGPVKRVSFSTTHSVINDSGEEVVAVRHRDSITSASTDSSEESTSSGEGRMSSISHRGSKLRPKLPVTTGTTKQISEMVQTSLDGSYGSLDGSIENWAPGLSSPVQQKDVSERRKSAPVCPSGDMYGERRPESGQGQGHPAQRSLSQPGQYEQLTMSPTSQPQYPGYPYNKPHKSIMSPPPQKGIRTHSRGSSLSSLSSSDSNQSAGLVMSPTSPTPSYASADSNNQSPWCFYESIDSVKAKAAGMPGGMGMKQPPPTAQKPSGIKKPRPQSGPSTGPVEKGHRRNTSKSSLESVEEVPSGSEGAPSPVSVSSPVRLPQGMNHPAYPGPNHPAQGINHPTQQGMNHQAQQGYNHPAQQGMNHPAQQGMNHPSQQGMGDPCNVGLGQTRQGMNHPANHHPSQPGPNHHPSQPGPNHHLSQPNTPTMSMSAPNFSTETPYGSMSPPVMHQSSHIPVPVPSTPPSSQHPPQQPGLGCLSPRLPGHRTSIPKPITTPPTTPPTLVPPAPRAHSASDKTHKKRPSGGNIVVNGNQVISGSAGSSGYPDIVSSGRCSGGMAAEYPSMPQGSQGSPRQQGHARSSSEDSNYSPLPFMVELSKHMHKPQPQPNYGPPEAKCPPEVLPKPITSEHRPKINGNFNGNCNSVDSNNQAGNQPGPTPNSHTHIPVPISATDNLAKQKKVLPPPPPRRSEKTRLSNSASSSARSSMAEPSYVPNDEQTVSSPPVVFKNDLEGIVDINDLPLPPPELLEGFEGGEASGTGGTRGKPPAPPPPPKRNKETQLSAAS